MKVISETIPKALVLIPVFTIICGIIYPFVMTGIAQLLFSDKANGSIVERDGQKYGSELLAQPFAGEKYLWGRVMNSDTDAYQKDGKPLYYSGPSNISPASKEYGELVFQRASEMQRKNQSTEPVPVDLVTSSGSGLDPEISVKAAKYQVDRIAKARNMAKEEVEQIIDQYTTHRFAGVFGEDTVNVLKVNLALDHIIE